MTTTPVSIEKLNEAQGAVDVAFKAWRESAEQKRNADRSESTLKSALVDAQRRFDDLTSRFRQEHNYDDRSTSWSQGQAHGFVPHERKAGE